VGVAAVGFVIYEIDRRQRKRHDIWDVLGPVDEVRTAFLESMVASGELQPFTGSALP
jgi:hypothetical protein